MKHLLLLAVLVFVNTLGVSQTQNSSCLLHHNIIERQLLINPNSEIELAQTELDLQKIITEFSSNDVCGNGSTYVVPVVMHIFHWEEDGKIGFDQENSGLELLNQDFNGLNDGWNNIDSEFDSIKGTLDITFCLAQIDPNGNPTNGLVYHENQDEMLNDGDLFVHAWDNSKYLNIYFPKYVFGSPSDFTAYAYYPSTINIDNDMDGVFYSSIRWVYGDHSELIEGDDWASVSTHELGHWLDLARSTTYISRWM